VRRLLAFWLEPAPMRSWAGYWLAPAPVVDLAMVRVVTVATQLALVLWYGQYATDRLEAYAGLDPAMYVAHPLFRLLTLPLGPDYRPTFEHLALVRQVAIVSGVLAMLGLLTRLSLAVFLYASLFLILHFYSYGDFHHTEAPLVLCLALVALSPAAGGALSLDRLLRRGRRPAGRSVLDETSPHARWPVLLAQWLFALIYLSAVLKKLVFTGGLDWPNGYTLQYFMAHDSLARGSLLGLWMHRFWWVILLGQWVVLLFQGTFWVSLVFPRLKLLYVPVGFMFHLSILLALNAVFVEWMGAYAIFVPWAGLARLLGRGRASRPPAAAGVAR
jgi:uncharacterized membrane protein YphA (DoxX/SURF4 family)